MVTPDARAGDVLSHGHLFGLKTDVKNNVHFVDEHLVVYPCGHSVVFLHVESRAQQVRQACILVHSCGWLRHNLDRKISCEFLHPCYNNYWVSRFNQRQ